MLNNFFENPAEAKRAMKTNAFREVYLSTSADRSIDVKGWIAQANPYDRHGKRWHLYLPRVEILKRLAMRNRKNLSATVEDRPVALTR